MSDRAKAFLAQIGIVPGEEAHEAHGVKGMKWGVRKKRPTSSSSSTSTKSKSSPPKKATTTPAKRPNTFRAKPANRRMSDAEMRTKLNRLQMEKQLKELTASPQAKSFMRELLADSGKQAARSVAKSAVNVGLQLALESAAKNATGSSKVFLTAMAAQGQKKSKG